MDDKEIEDVKKTLKLEDEKLLNQFIREQKKDLVTFEPESDDETASNTYKSIAQSDGEQTTSEIGASISVLLGQSTSDKPTELVINELSERLEKERERRMQMEKELKQLIKLKDQYNFTD